MSDKTYMTNQEAVDALQKYFPAVPHAKVRYAAAMGVEALKKQIPKKPYKCGNFFIINRCPTCNKFVPIEGKHCIECGQALDWGD